MAALVSSTRLPARALFHSSIALAPLALALIAAPASAQDATQAAAPTQAAVNPPQTLADQTPQIPPPADNAQGDVVVTGTLIRNQAAATASPITVLSSADLANRGINTVADALQQLSANNAGTIGASWSSFGFATGATAPSLRGFNDAFTLTIFDGLRTAPYPLADDGYRNFVDINTIPDSIVDRIEVLQDGASATYGSDAVAGVVNVLIKKQIKGLHLNGSAGISEHGDAGEQRFDATYGYGDLSEKGFNFYVNGEYQRNEPLFFRDRGYPYNTADQSKYCVNSTITPGTVSCGVNSVRNGIQADGTYNGFQSSIVPFVRQYDATGTTPTGRYTFINPAAGCRSLTPLTLSAAQLAANAGSTPTTVCEQDTTNRYYQYNPYIQRIGGTAHLTANIGSHAQAYAMFNFYQTKTTQQTSPDAFANTTAPVGTQDTSLVSPIFLPIYVCPTGRGTLTAVGAVSTGCTAANGTLNTTNNPFAALGSLARLSGQYDLPRTTTTKANTYRITGGVSGSFGGDINYRLDATHSWVTLDVNQYNYLEVQNFLDAIAQGTYNFASPSANTQAQRDFIAPPVHQHSVSTLTQIEGNVSKGFFQMPGGPLTVAIGGAWRRESINNPSANPGNPNNPLDIYYTVNTFSTQGSRSVWSAFYEVDAPVFDQLHLKADGRYDSYSLSYSSKGFSYFAPKFEAELKPIRQFKIRGTYSRGFAVPSIAEASSTTTGYVTTVINCQQYAAFCASHASNPAYYQGLVGYGITAIANPNLQPQKSRSFTGGVAFTPTRWLTLTADYWNTKIDQYIVSLNGAAVSQYYNNNGNVTIPGVTAIPGDPDEQNPNALPLLSTIQNPYANAASLLGTGVDLSATINLPIMANLRWSSKGTASYLDKLKLTDASGAVQRWDGSLSPCNISSCSGAPKWRATWSNTFDYKNRVSLTVTGNYTSGYLLESTDLGGIYGDCANSVGASVATAQDGTPLRCSANATFSADLTANLKVTDRFTFYVNVLNVTDSKPPYDPSAGYYLYQFNPAYADRNFIGRYFRLGAKVDF